MQITIISPVQISKVPTAKGSYDLLEVAYKNGDGKVEGKKLYSFNNKEVFNAAKSAVVGTTYSVGMAKNDKGYWEWTSFAEAGSTGGGDSGKPSATRYGYSGETPEERAKKQLYIIRQSCLSTAASLFAHNKKDVWAGDVIKMAIQFENHVLGVEEDMTKDYDSGDAFKGMEDDIPT